MKRYFTHLTIANDSSFYDKQLKARDTEKIIHYQVKPYLSLPREFVEKLDYIQETWKLETKLHSLAYKYYKDTTLWWVIGLVNLKPSDLNWMPGDVVYIPTDPGLILDYLRL